MITPKSLALAIANWLTRILLFATAAISALVLTFGNPNVIKNALIEADAYNRFVPSIIQANLASNQTNGLPLKDREVQAIIQSSFPADSLRTNTELFVDSIYRWLNRQTKTPDYVINFQPNVDVAATKLGDYAFNRLILLQPCVDQPLTLDPFTATCEPDNLDVTAEKSALVNSIRQDGAILPKTVLTAADLPKNTSGMTIVEAYPNIPQWYGWVTLAPWLLGLATVMSGLAVIWLSRSKRLAFKQLGRSVLSNGIFLCLSPIVFGFVLPNYTKDIQTSFGSAGTQTVLSDVSQKISTELNIWLIIVGSMIIIVGTAVLLLEKATLPKYKYSGVGRKSGMVSSIGKRSANGRFKLDPSKVPLQSSEISVTKKPKTKTNAKYRKIPKKEL